MVCANLNGVLFLLVGMISLIFGIVFASSISRFFSFDSFRFCVVIFFFGHLIALAYSLNCVFREFDCFLMGLYGSLQRLVVRSWSVASFQSILDS